GLHHRRAAPCPRPAIRRAFDHADEFPSVEPGIVGAQGRRGVPGFAIVSDYTEFVEDLSSGEAYGGPKALAGAMLFRHRRAGNRNHLCVPQMTPAVPSLSSYLQEFAPPAYGSQQRAYEQTRYGHAPRLPAMVQRAKKLQWSARRAQRTAVLDALRATAISSREWQRLQRTSRPLADRTAALPARLCRVGAGA